MVYLDAAATSLNKPPEVARAMAYACTHAASPGRGGHRAARLAEELAYACRAEAAGLFGVSAPEQVVFTCSATHALNLAIRSLVRPGSRVVVSGYEHNAVMRTLQGIGSVDIIFARGALFRPDEVLSAYERSVVPGVDAVIVNHVSNVFGFIQPVEEVAALCRRRSVPLIVDASQSAGALPVDLEGWGAAFVAMPGHKGLCGPQGTGLLLCGGAETHPLLFGGTGSASLEPEMPAELPDRLEPGTHNMPGIAGLLEGLRFVRRTGIGRIAAHERRLIRRAAERLSAVKGLRIFAAPEGTAQAGVLSLTAEGLGSEELAAALDRHQIAVRAGLHCAPLAHRTAGTLPDGTVRISVSAFSTAADVDAFCRAATQIVHENVTG
ncbi:MAG: aminotransferase class V-fold PLP-dependent enzyme [Oscillospiraceae bacterium]|nr:aminotransferase class V-fold PLP-dependent enzyme [Oscillospiraceae bacterium]